MPKALFNVNCLLVGVTSKQRKIISQNIISEGGSVLPISASLFGPTVISPEVTHIVVDQRQMTYDALLKACNCSTIPPNIPVVHTSWIIFCCHEKAMVDPTPHMVCVSNTPTGTVSTDTDAVTSCESTTAAFPPLESTGYLPLVIPEDANPCAMPILHSEDASEPPAKRLRSAITSSEFVSDDSDHDIWSSSLLPEAVDKSSTDLSCLFSSTPFSSFSFNSWHDFDGMLFKFQPPSLRSTSTNDHAILPIVGFDLDHTLITTKSGNTHAKSEADWTLWHREVPMVLQRVACLPVKGCTSTEAHHPVQYLIISNQGGVGQHSTTEALQRKVDAVAAALGSPISFICYTAIGIHRKPRRSMWDFYRMFIAHHCRLGSADLVKMVLYVGDAAGRAADGPRKKDFSDTDLKLAKNIGCQFQTPEVFFLNSTKTLHRRVACAALPLSEHSKHSDALNALFPAAHGGAAAAISMSDSAGAADTADAARSPLLEIILIVGPPASGKSTLARKLERVGYVRVNQDSLKTLDKCLKTARLALQASSRTDFRGVVVDNTNLDRTVRTLWIKLAQEYNTQIRAVCMDAPKEVCSALEKLRIIDPATPEHERRPIPTFVLSKFFKDIQWPRKEEGFTDVIILPFSPCLGESETTMALLHSHLI